MQALAKTLQELQKMAQSAGAERAVEYTRILYAVQKKIPDSILAPLQESGELYKFTDIYKTYKAETFPRLQAILKSDIDKLPVINILIILHILGSAKKNSSVNWEEPERGSVSIVNKRQLSEIFGVSQQAIDKWDKEGLPVEARGVKGTRGKENEYNTVRVYNWLLERYKKSNLSDLDIERTRLIKAQADKAEAEYMRTVRELLPVDIVMQTVQSSIVMARTRMLGVTNDIKIQLPEMSPAALDIVDRTIREAMEDLGSANSQRNLIETVDRYYDNVVSAEASEGE